MKSFPLVLLCLIAIAVSAGAIYTSEIMERMPGAAGDVIEVSVAYGWSAGDISSEFERLGVVTSSKKLSRQMVSLGIDRKIRPGTYRIHAGLARDVAKELERAVPEANKIQVLPGALFAEIAAELRRDDAPELLLDALRSPDNFAWQLRPLLHGNPAERIVLLAPETYEILPGGSAARDLVKTASEKWWRLHSADVSAGFTSEDLSNAGILASIIQKEALVDSDRPIIAGVFKNRLGMDMPLQSCATVVHAWRLRGVKITSVSFEDVKIDSPFNTYEHKGLPPENIGVPSEKSWEAALRPAATKMLFFVAKNDGSHVFTQTYEEHLAAQRKIRRGEM
ncbi:MAG: endolytic transglycosylase MltG [Synergistaceae bacterium]|jgi:UPF0755 protein|nr:endolytic transglycosylase MltG [Synergistaceae bacterium]